MGELPESTQPEPTEAAEAPAEEASEGLTAPTSNDVGEQTETKASQDESDDESDDDDADAEA